MLRSNAPNNQVTWDHGTLEWKNIPGSEGTFMTATSLQIRLSLRRGCRKATLFLCRPETRAECSVDPPQKMQSIVIRLLVVDYSTSLHKHSSGTHEDACDERYCMSRVDWECGVRPLAKKLAIDGDLNSLLSFSKLPTSSMESEQMESQRWFCSWTWRKTVESHEILRNWITITTPPPSIQEL